MINITEFFRVIESSSAVSIAIDSGHIYIGGGSNRFVDRANTGRYDRPLFPRGFYWKVDGTTITDHLIGGGGVSSSIAIDSGNVHGIVNYNGECYYWKDDGTNITATVAFRGRGLDIAIDSGDVHIVGNVDTGASSVSPIIGEVSARYWKNGVLIPLNTAVFHSSSSFSVGHSSANSIFIDSGNVYIAGSIDYSRYLSFSEAIYWTNDNFRTFSAHLIETQGSAITLNSGEIYLAGTGLRRDNSYSSFLGWGAYYWRGGSMKTLHESSSRPYVSAIVFR